MFAPKLKPLLALASLGLLVYGGYSLHARTDWAVAASPPVSPAVVWGACLLNDKPIALEGSKPGIEPRSHLYYHPIVQGEGDGRKHTGWMFYGDFEKDGGVVNFRCETDLLGESVRWGNPTIQ